MQQDNGDRTQYGATILGSLTGPHRTAILSSLIGPYPVLGLVLLVIETALLYWLFSAAATWERVTAGGFMLLPICAVIVAVVLVNRNLPPSRQALAVDNPGARKDEILRQDPERIGAPDGSYMINKPPSRWSYREMTIEQMIKETISAPAHVLSNMILPRVSSIILFLYNKPVEFTPILGKTLLNGRKIPLLLPGDLNRRLVISTINHAQPPFFIENSLTHNVISFIAPVMSAFPLQSISHGVLPKTDRELIVITSQQIIEHIFLDGKHVDYLTIDVSMIGVRGDIYDYILTTTNFRIGRSADLEADRCASELKGILETFRPLTIADPGAKQRDDNTKAELAFNKFMADPDKNKEFFYNQFIIAVWRIQKFDLGTSVGISEAIKLLQPFRKFANEGGIEDDELTRLWAEMDEAEKGETRNFGKHLQEILEEGRGNA